MFYYIIKNNSAEKPYEVVFVGQGSLVAAVDKLKALRREDKRGVYTLTLELDV